MQKILCSCFFVLFLFIASAQIKKPYSWSFAAQKMTSTKYEIKFTVNLEKDWHIYSQNTPPGGPFATKFSFTPNPLLFTVGNVKETGKLESYFEKLFDLDVKQYSGKLVFTQIIQLKTKAKTNFAGTVEFMVCNGNECLPKTKQNFNIRLQ